MARRKSLRLAGLVLVGALLGYIVGPPAVQAAADLVKVKSGSASKNNEARVTAKRLWVDVIPPPGDDPDKINSTDAGVITQFFTFTNDPDNGLVVQKKETNLPLTFLCPAGPGGVVITGLDVSTSFPPGPTGTGQLARLKLGNLGVGVLDVLWEQWHPHGFHDDTGVRLAGTGNELHLESTMYGAANKVCTDTGCTLVPAEFDVVTSLQFYCP